MLKLNKFTPLFGPAITGSLIGGFYGYNKYQETKNQDFTTDYLQVVGNIIVGSGCGFAVGLLWFISVPMLINRKYESISYNGKNIVRIYKK